MSIKSLTPTKNKISGRKCKRCGKDTGVNYYYCLSCHNALSASNFDADYSVHSSGRVTCGAKAK